MRLLRNPAILGAFALAGCVSLAPEVEVPETVSAMPADYGKADVAGEYRPARWWAAFEDPTLDALVDEALRDNLDIAEAAARVEQAAAQARIARSALFPSLDATLGSNYSDSSLSGSAFGGLAGGAAPARFEIENYSATLGAAYEIDLFGRARNDLLAARADAGAAEFDYRAVQLAAAAQAIGTYFEIVDIRRQIELTLLTTDVLADRVARTEDRYRSGLAESFELYQVRQDLRTTQASLPVRESALAAAQGRLGVLLGDYPEQLDAKLAGVLNPRLAFDPVPAGLPADLLAQRPDVAAAWQRFEAARLRIGARRAERFPSIRLSGSIGGQGGDPGAALDFGGNWALSLASSITAPIFDAGRISARIRAARAGYDASAAAYARAVLNAYREANVAIEDYEEQRQRYGLILAQLSDAEATLDLQARRYRAGVGSYVAYLDGLRATYQLRSGLSAAARDVALARLGVHRALGGDWVPTGTETASGQEEDME